MIVFNYQCVLLSPFTFLTQSQAPHPFGNQYKKLSEFWKLNKGKQILEGGQMWNK